MTGCITVFGGTGFIGRHLVALLLGSGATVRVAVRHPGRVKVATEADRAPEMVQADVLDDVAVGRAAGKTYEFGGPQVYSFKALLELLLTALDRQRVLIPIPFALAEMQAGLLELFPNPPLTRDQVRLLKTDKVVSGTEPTLSDLGMQPRPLEEFLAVFKDKCG